MTIVRPPNRQPATGSPRPLVGLVLAAIIAVSLALRLAVALPMDIFQDEALYWWGARPAELSFSPQPPGVYLAVLAGTRAFGHSLLGLRAATLVLGTISVLLVYLLGRDLYGPRAGLWAAAFFVFCPLLSGSGAAATPDGLIVFCWLLCAWAVWRAVAAPGPGWWALAGLALAAGLYSKYMMVLAFPAAFLALVASREGRRALRRPWPWAAAGVALALFLPIFLGWQASHGWPATRYHLAARHEWAPSLRRVGSYVVNHAAAYSPVLWAGAIGALIAAARAAWRGEARAALVAGFGLLPIAFFLPPSVGTKNPMIQMHWASFGYAVGIVALGGLAAAGGRWRRRLGVAALGMGGVTTAAILVGVTFPQAPLALGMRPPGHRLLPWRELAEHLVARGLADELIVTDTFGTTMGLGFHLGRRAGLYTLDGQRSQVYGLVDQLRLWRTNEASLLAERGGRDVLYVHEHSCFSRCDCTEEPLRVAKLFREASLIGSVPLFHGDQRAKCFHIYRLR